MLKLCAIPFLWLCSFVLLPHQTAASITPDSTVVNKRRLTALGATFGAGYTGMMVSLSKAWYSKEERTGFHFFNDNGEWKQMDKAGHFWGSFQESRAGVDMLRWAGLPEKKAIIYGGLMGLALQTPIEVFDGYQSEYGASVGDLIANATGSASVIAQELAWHEIRILPKYSFHTTRFAAERPNVLGSNLGEQALKDYNGQTYWLSVDVGKFLPAESRYPKWLNIAVGYGAEEMVYNHKATNESFGFQAHRQFYLSPDLNLMYFKGRSKLLNATLYVLSIIKFPAPTLEYNSHSGFKVHPFYF
jgi:hypothetical protein